MNSHSAIFQCHSAIFQLITKGSLGYLRSMYFSDSSACGQICLHSPICCCYVFVSPGGGALSIPPWSVKFGLSPVLKQVFFHFHLDQLQSAILAKCLCVFQGITAHRVSQPKLRFFSPLKNLVETIYVCIYLYLEIYTYIVIYNYI